MRRALVCTLAVPALILAGCSGDAEPTRTSPTVGTASDDAADDAADQTTEGAADGSGGTAADDDAADTADDEATSDTDAAGSTAGAGDPDEVEGGADGQAAADVAKAFYVAMIEADGKVCDHLLSFSDAEKPMKDQPSDYETCQELLPEVLADVAPSGDDELTAIIEAMQIRGADVQGDTAVVDADNYSDLFAQTIGQDPITLRKIGDEWYIDLDHSFQTAD